MLYTWKIQLFAGLAQRFHNDHCIIELTQPQLTCGELKQALSERYPEQAALLKSCYVAANQSYCKEEQLIQAGDELALLPPVSGGQSGSVNEPAHQEQAQPRFAITSEPINAADVMNKVITPACGATLLFVGTTREFTDGLRTVSLHYEAYEPMAIKTMEQIGEEIAARWSGAEVAITHRIGKVDLAEISVVIAVATARRADCYEASRYAIERLKQIVPIWKKEIWEDGSEWQGHQLGPWDPTAPAPAQAEQQME